MGLFEHERPATLPTPRRVLCCVACALVALITLGSLSLPVRANEASSTPEPTPTFSSLEELKGRTFCAVMGSVAPDYVKDKIGEQHFDYYQSVSDCFQAVLEGRADVFTVDEPIAQYGLTQLDGLAIMDEHFSNCDYALCLPQGSAYEQPFLAALDRMEKDGTLAALYKTWTSGGEVEPVVQDWPGEAGTLVYELDPTKTPMSYANSENQPMGYEPAVVFAIAKQLDLTVEMHYTQFASLLADLEVGKADVVTSAITVTPERQEKVLMLKDGVGGIVPVVKAQATGATSAGEKDFFAGLAQSFERTFLVEGRMGKILSGLGITVLIAGASGVLGLLLAYVLCLVRRRKNRLADALIRGFSSLMGGLPVVVVLMMLYYVAFGSIDLSGVVVSVIGFTLMFGMSAHGVMQAGIDSVDPGQDEGAVALGYTRRASFHKVVFPQAMRQFMPVLAGELVGLLKNTSVVGYIAVEDLTRASDLIRAQTMEAFFPLIATALVYFLLAMLITTGARHVSRRLAVEKHPRVIKGVRA